MVPALNSKAETAKAFSERCDDLSLLTIGINPTASFAFKCGSNIGKATQKLIEGYNKPPYKDLTELLQRVYSTLSDIILMIPNFAFLPHLFYCQLGICILNVIIECKDTIKNSKMTNGEKVQLFLRDVTTVLLISVLVGRICYLLRTEYAFLVGPLLLSLKHLLFKAIDTQFKDFSKLTKVVTKKVKFEKRINSLIDAKLMSLIV